MVIIGMMSYPTESAKEMYNRYKTLPPIPEYMKMKGPYWNSEVGVGYNVITIYEFEKSKMKEGNDVILGRYARFMGIRGFTFSVQLWLEMSD